MSTHTIPVDYILVSAHVALRKDMSSSLIILPETVVHQQGTWHLSSVPYIFAKYCLLILYTCIVKQH